MAGFTDRTPFKKEAERMLPCRVDIAVPEGGLGRRLTDMLRGAVRTSWAEHGHSEKRKGEAPRDFARFYFAAEMDAEAFRKRWVNKGD